MKIINNNSMANVSGGVSNRTCMILGYTTFGYALAQQWGWAVGTFAGAAGAGCFDK